MAGLSKWELAAVDSLGGACKSLLLASAVIKVTPYMSFLDADQQARPRAGLAGPRSSAIWPCVCGFAMHASNVCQCQLVCALCVCHTSPAAAACRSS